METAIVEYCKKFKKNLIKRTDKTDVSLFKDEFGFELPDEIADYINIFWHSGISGYTNCPECIVLFPVQKKEGDISNDILFYENGLISLSRRWNEIGDIHRYIPVGWLGYSGGYVLYEVKTNNIFIEDMNADSDGVVEDKPIADSLKDLITQLDLK